MAHLLDRNIKAADNFEMEEFLKDVNPVWLSGMETHHTTSHDTPKHENTGAPNAKVSYINVKQQCKVDKFLHKFEKKLKSAFGVGIDEPHPPPLFNNIIQLPM